MKSFLHFFVILLLGTSSDSVSCQSIQSNRSYQATFDSKFINRDEEIGGAFLIHFNQGFHGKKGFSFLYDLSIRTVDLGREIELATFYRKAYLRNEKIEAYLGMELGSRKYNSSGRRSNNRPDSWRFFIAADAGYQFFLNKNTALEWNISYPFLTSEPPFLKNNWPNELDLGVGRLNTTLKLRYYLKSQTKEEKALNDYSLYKNRWMIGGVMELGVLNEFDREVNSLSNVINPVFGIMASEKWMVGSGIHISTATRPLDLIYFGVSPFIRNYPTKAYERLAVYWELWASLTNKSILPETTKDFNLIDIGAGSGFGIGYWLNPNVLLDFSSGLRLFKDAEEYSISRKTSFYNLAYFKVGMETFL